MGKRKKNPIDDIRDNVISLSDSIWLPPSKIRFKCIDCNSYNDIYESISDNTHKHNCKSKLNFDMDIIDDIQYKSKKLILKIGQPPEKNNK